MLIGVEDIPLGEKDGPITFVTVDERKDEGPGICHVSADVKKILKEPEERKREAVGLAVEKEKCGAQKRHDEFPERATENHHGVAEVAKEGMAGFVDDQVCVVEKKEAGGVAPGVEEEEEVEREDDGAAEAGNASPMIRAVELHEMRVARGVAGKRGKEGSGACCVTEWEGLHALGFGFGREGFCGF